ncbi:MAG: fibronectin type III domain-containing protein [Erysipelotrichales bacterium]|nr:fibronectin type III domain-containing protein [Erysipelotrichales bacterium]
MTVKAEDFPTIIADFEGTKIGNEPGQWFFSKNQPSIEATLSLNEDERYVRFGKKSLRLDFDIRNTTGVAAISVYQSASPLEAYPYRFFTPPGQPTSIGIWVYGTFAKGTWVRIQYYIGTAIFYGNFGLIDWDGWKYLEIPLNNPDKLPVKIQFPIRVLALEDKERIAGTIFYDNLQIKYSEQKEDLTPPLIANVEPLENSFCENHNFFISAIISDKESGVDKSNIFLSVDGLEIRDLEFIKVSNGLKVRCPKELSVQFSSGMHQVKIKAYDNAGNFAVYEWLFGINSFYPLISSKYPSHNLAAGQTFEYQIFTDRYTDFSRLYLNACFNKQALKIRSINASYKEIQFEEKLINDEAGLINISISQMGTVKKFKAETPLLTISFLVLPEIKGEAWFKVLDATVFTADNPVPINVILNNFSLPVHYPYYLSFIGATKESITTFQLIANHKPVDKARIEVLLPEKLGIKGQTNRQGRLLTKVLGKLRPMEKAKVRAFKKGMYSNPVEVTILESLGESVPGRVIVSVGETPRSLAFSWETNLSVNGSEVRIAFDDKKVFKTYTGKNRRRIFVNTEIGRSETLMHEVSIQGLLPDTEYQYQVGFREHFSEWKTIKTLKEKNKIAFLFYTDPQAFNEVGYLPLKKIFSVSKELNENISFAVSAGDIVDNADNYQEWAFFDKVNKEELACLPHAMGIGNHEAVSNREMFKGAFANPLNGIKGLERSNFFFTAGEALFLFIDSEQVNRFADQKTWLKRVVSTHPQTFRIVVMHRGPYPIYYAFQSVNDFNELFEELNIDLVLSGHDHIYNRAKINNITYITGGSSGNKYYSKKPENDHFEAIYADHTPVFSIIEYNASEICFKAYTNTKTETKLIDACILKKKQ